MTALEDIRPLLISRKQACRQLLGDSSSDESSPGSVPRHKYTERVSRLDKLEQKQAEMKQMFHEFLEKFESRALSEEDSE
nr:unnamed protein product [Callosobruchus analis]